jgi:hypothetical protein
MICWLRSLHELSTERAKALVVLFVGIDGDAV